jgi:hypothetical protein
MFSRYLSRYFNIHQTKQKINFDPLKNQNGIGASERLVRLCDQPNSAEDFENDREWMIDSFQKIEIAH